MTFFESTSVSFGFSAPPTAAWGEAASALSPTAACGRGAAAVFRGHVAVRAGDRRSDVHGGFGIDRGGDRRVIDDHGLDAVGGGRLQFGDDDRDGLAGEHDLAGCQRLEHPHVAVALDRQIVRGQDGHDARRREGGASCRSS